MWRSGKVPLGYDARDPKLVLNEAEATRTRRVSELFTETGSGTETAKRLQAEGVTSKSSWPRDKGDVDKILSLSLSLRIYIGEVTHKRQVGTGEHQAVVPRDLWGCKQAVTQDGARTRAARNRQHAPDLVASPGFGGQPIRPLRVPSKHFRPPGRDQRMSRDRLAGSGGGGDCPRTTRRHPRSPRRWSPSPRSASCSIASLIQIAGDCPPHDFANALLMVIQISAFEVAGLSYKEREGLPKGRARSTIPTNGSRTAIFEVPAHRMVHAIAVRYRTGKVTIGSTAVAGQQRPSIQRVVAPRQCRRS